MKSLITIVIAFGLILNSYSQKLEAPSFKVHVNNRAGKNIKLNQELRVIDGFNIAVKPQFGNLFMTRSEAKKAKINLKDYYNDFDFGFNMGFNYSLKKKVLLKGLYNVGMLKFDPSGSAKSKGYVVQLSIDYVF